MIRPFLCFLLLMISSTVFSASVDDLFGDGERDFEFTRFSNEEILLQIEEDARIACIGTLCTLHAIDNQYNSFEIKFNVGQGGSSSSGFPGSSSSSSGGNDVKWSLDIKYRTGRCTQKVNVDRTIYFVVKRYLYGLINEDGSPRQTLTPADTAMLKFIGEILSKATGCSLS